MLMLRLAVTAAMLAGSAAAMAAETTPAPAAPFVPSVKMLPASETPKAVVVVADTADTEKLICKRQEVIGSLIQKKRVCMTARNWERNTKNAQDNLQEFTKPGAFSPNG